MKYIFTIVVAEGARVSGTGHLRIIKSIIVRLFIVSVGIVYMSVNIGVNFDLALC